MELFYLAALFGSCSIGYSILRAGFPKKQGASISEKVLLGYLFGIIVILPGTLAAISYNSVAVSIQAFFLISGLMYLALFTIFLAKRKILNETDTTPIKAPKKKWELPKKLIEQDTKEQRQKMVTTAKVKEQLFKEKEPNVIAEIKKKTSEIEQKNNVVEKKEMLKKLKDFAKKINEDEVNEDELKELSENEF